MKVTKQDVALDVIDSAMLVAADFEVQVPDYLELADGTRARLIKRAHDLDASLIEMHSHPGPWDAAFSRSDLLGLSETVPHMWWRLEKRPDAAIVIAPSGFDAMVWLDGPLSPQAELIHWPPVYGSSARPTSRCERGMNKIPERYDRSMRLFGADGHRATPGASPWQSSVAGVWVVLVAQHAALLGVKRITSIDPEELDETNRNRFVGARITDPVPGP